MDDYISRKEHEAFADLMRSENKRLEDENNRQNKRLAEVETKVGELIDISTSIKSMTVEIKTSLTRLPKWIAGLRSWKAGMGRCGGK